jgi:endonuclease G, mitochondrial
LFDPCWGDASDPAQALAESKLGAEDTFHYTNAAPQVQTYNDIDWGNLEDYLLDKAQTTEKLLTVFTGPIFREDDPSYGKGRTGGPWKIPLSFWKIAVLQKTPTKIAAAAFIVGQTQYVQALYEAKVFSGLSPTPSMKCENAKSRRPSKQSKRKPVSIFRWCVRSMRKERWSRPDRQGGSTI